MNDCQLCGSERDDCEVVRADGIGHSAFKRGENYYLCPFCYTSSPSGMAEGYLGSERKELWVIAGRIANYLEKRINDKRKS